MVSVLNTVVVCGMQISSRMRAANTSARWTEPSHIYTLFISLFHALVFNSNLIFQKFLRTI